MATINQNYMKLAAGYLFPEIGRRVRAFTAENPTVEIMRLGIGNTTEPLTPTVVQGLHQGVDRLACRDTYTGYADDSSGEMFMKQALQRHYQRFGVELQLAEIYISDGAKPDSGNIQSIFAPENVVAVQDPAYPVYVDSNVMAGRSGGYDQQKRLYAGLVYMPCTEENQFFPALPEKKVDLIYLCSPNNPTGAVATREQLERFVRHAQQHRAVIIFDAAYSAFIREPHLPRSIYEIKGAAECAIEINSFSKIAGFTGVRLGWSIIPLSLVAEDASPGVLNQLWSRRQNTLFNGASNIVQGGGAAALSEEGWRECGYLVDYYMNNAAIIKSGLESVGFSCFGGTNAPFIWLKTPGGMSSWDFFDFLLRETHVVGTPGSGFGPSGESYFRLSAYGHRENVEKAVAAIQFRFKR
ncbi:MAG: LL-diaminopimelate aminotransferase [Calditrichaeota bacterium]|nr:MAG: LL-diaminopimelate aminotransferase [Calditrichota bacterium]